MPTLVAYRSLILLLFKRTPTTKSTKKSKRRLNKLLRRELKKNVSKNRLEKINLNMMPMREIRKSKKKLSRTWTASSTSFKENSVEILIFVNNRPLC